MSKHAPRSEAWKATCVVDCRNGLGEGCIWDHDGKVVWWVELVRPALHQFDPRAGSHCVWPSPELITSVSVRTNGTLLVSGKSGLSEFNQSNGKFTHFADFPMQEAENRPNDSGVDKRGRLWLGTVHDTMTPGREMLPFNESAGTLYRIDPDLRMMSMESQVGISNGIQWSPDDKVLYFVDSLSAVIFAYDYELDAGTISNRRVFAQPSGLGLPDGAAMDSDGYLWSARWDGSCVVRFAPDGQIDRIVSIPAERVTSCAFGGVELDTLYITTARCELSERSLAQQPLQGGLFAFHPGVKGLPRNKFRG